MAPASGPFVCGQQRALMKQTCPYRKSNPDVLMVEFAQDRQAENAANGLNIFDTI